jgi:hypothetical protein
MLLSVCHNILQFLVRCTNFITVGKHYQTQPLFLISYITAFVQRVMYLNEVECCCPADIVGNAEVIFVLVVSNVST